MMNHPTRWFFARPTWTQRLRMHLYFPELEQIAWQILRWLLLMCIGFAIYSFGHVAGERSIEACNVDKGQTAIGVFAFRTEDGVLHCQIRSNPFYAPRGKKV